MGATIGINTFLLLAMATDIAGPDAGRNRSFVIGYWLANAALPVFWISLVVAGVLKAGWQMDADQLPFSTMMLRLRPAFAVFAASGTVLMTGLWLMAGTLFRNLFWSPGHSGA
jgi:nitric oxide reductase subunit B